MGGYKRDVYGAKQYLSLREKLKEPIREKLNKELRTPTSSSSDKFGCFFGPSETVIARRVIEESRSLLGSTVCPKSQRNGSGSKVNNVTCKNKRVDYSFLSCDDEVAAEALTPTSKMLVPKHCKLDPKAKDGLTEKRASKLAGQKVRLLDKVTKPAAKLNLERPVAEKKHQQITSRVISRDRLRTGSKIARARLHDEESENEKAIKMIRQMTGYNPKKFRDNDDDDKGMEANFDEIMREEKRSAKLARKEDDEQLRLIQEEEKMRLTKKRRLAH